LSRKFQWTRIKSLWQASPNCSLLAAGVLQL
jgi:hypothetical protein